jgi:hypothetical protein
MRRKSTALKSSTVIKGIIVCTAICLAGLGYVWAKTQVWGLSKEMKKLELHLDELKRQNDVLQRTYAAMCAPATLDARVRQLNLGLSAPLPSQIVRMPSTATTPIVENSPENKVYAATNNEN